MSGNSSANEPTALRLEEEGSAELASLEAVERAFGVENRTRLLNRYFSGRTVIPRDAWQHVYRLLLWIDRTTALAHCYESDKAQPGRPWYARSLAFHAWVSAELEVAPAKLGEHIDWMFREAIKDLTTRTLTRREEIYLQQRLAYTDRGFPEPGEDPELVAIIREVLGEHLSSEPTQQVLSVLTRRIYAYIMQENKRKNLVGEGFEDTLAATIRRLPFARGLDIRTRSLLQDLPGFREPAPNEKTERVDLAVLGRGQRNLVTAKWSVRADRERQFDAEFQVYARLEAAGQDFAYVLVTNEFDAARLKAACERRRQNALLFSKVVHVNPQGVLAAYGSGGRGAITDVREHIRKGRLLGLGEWLSSLE